MQNWRRPLKDFDTIFGTMKRERDFLRRWLGIQVRDKRDSLSLKIVWKGKNIKRNKIHEDRPFLKDSLLF